MTELQQKLRQQQGRWNRALLLGVLGRSLGFGLLAAGCLILLGRTNGWAVEAWVLPLCVAAALAWSIRLYQQRKVDVEQIAVLLDLRQGGRGELLHAYETGGQHSIRDDSTSPKPVMRRIAHSLAPGAIFLAASLFVPVRIPAIEPLAKLMEQRAEQLEELAASLDETLEIEEETREEIERNIEAIRNDDPSKPPLSTDAMREALDELEQRLQEAAELGAEQLEDVMREAEQAAEGQINPETELPEPELDALDEAIRKAEEQSWLERDRLNEEALSELAQSMPQDLLDKLQQLAESGKLGDLSELAKQLELSAEQLAKLAEALANGLSQQALERLAKLAELGLLDPGEFSGELPENFENLAGLAEAMQGMSLPGGTTSGAPGAPSTPGQSGVSRGPGSTPLTWGDETPEFGDQMQVRKVDVPDSPEQAMELIGLTQLAPTVNGVAEGPQATGGSVQTSGEAVWKRRVRPEHRKAVQRFFDGSKEPPK